MATLNSLVTRWAMAAQVVKGTYPTTPVQGVRASNLDSVVDFDRIENENHMTGVSQRSTSQQTVPTKSSVRVPITGEIYLYPLSLPYLLFGIGFVPGTAVVASGITTHKLVKSLPQEAPYLTNYIRYGAGSQAFTRQVQDVRFSELVLSLSRQGSTARVTGMGLNETGIAEAGYTVTNEVQEMFQPFLGGMIWDTTPVAGGSTYDFGIGREHEITITRTIEDDDQHLHKYQRNDNQELSFGITGVMRELDFSSAFYNALMYGNIGSMITANPTSVTILTGLTLELNTSGNIPAAAAPYKFIMNIPRAEIMLTNFRAQGNDPIRADAQWKMIDDQSTPPVRIELTNNVASYPYSNTLFTNGGGTLWTLPDATP